MKTGKAIKPALVMTPKDKRVEAVKDAAEFMEQVEGGAVMSIEDVMNWQGAHPMPWILKPT